MKIVAISLRNFRCFLGAQINPRKACLLIGENDVGKTAILHALCMVFGHWRPNPDDLYANDPGVATRERAPLEIEVGLAPDDPARGFTEEESAFFFEHFDISEDGSERLRIKLRYGWDPKREEFRAEARFQKRDGDGDEFTSRYAGRFGFFLIDALRDITREIANKTGLWGRLLASVTLSDPAQQRMIALVKEVHEVLQEDASLREIKERFENLIEDVLGLPPGIENVRLSPVPQDGREILRVADLHVRSKGSNLFLPIGRHGMGSQSAAVIALFRTWVERRDILNVFLGFEEPEAHLHPHVQRYLYVGLTEIGTQVFVTTHSTFVADRADLEDIVLLRRKGAECVARQIPVWDPTQRSRPFLPPDWKMTIKRYVEGNNSEIFFARCVLLVEGDSERYALPILARAMGIDLDRLGISIVAANSSDFGPFMRICSPHAFDIPWVVICDGDAVKKVARQLEKTGYIPVGSVKEALQSGDLIADILEPHDCYALSDFASRLNIERLLLARGFLDEYVQAISELDGPKALSNYIKQRAAKEPGFAMTSIEIQVYDYVRAHGSPRVARRVAEIITAVGRDLSRIPEEFKRPLEQAKAKAEATIGTC